MEGEPPAPDGRSRSAGERGGAPFLLQGEDHGTAPPPGRGAEPAAESRYALVRRLSVLRGADHAALAGRYAVVVGCGALGSAVAAHLVRGGVGRVRVVDRDVVEPRNLPHQPLYTDQDAAGAELKADAAATRLRTLNGGCRVDGVVADYAPDNALRLAAGADVLIDGADNLETKFLLNEVALVTGTPLVHAGCAGTEGTVLAVVPRVTPCLRCLWPRPSPAAARTTCRTHGLLPATAAVVAALQATEALKLLLRLPYRTLTGLVHADPWTASLRRVPLPPRPDPRRPCPACERGELPYLGGPPPVASRALCGESTVLITAPVPPDRDELARRHAANRTLRIRPGCLQLDLDGCRVVFYTSGRTLVHGAPDADHARALYARLLGPPGPERARPPAPGTERRPE
ncbi:ThiF family adenylyltransferase [Streptomyces zingiberis]|uniref:THIF-type NAD/FAD binding fold domain-containing protein n=1 Tax=Streptomyces zingiberis TaxID=2053010 RepID=A0ABX1BTJ6_9ACTN|nr:ThiF family adenylyltransferase [Streptomyces zingiberis]NJQ00413.1 hypothetical protein [Streptomyces zingiberis]